MNPMITIENMTKVYGGVSAVNNISLQVQPAEIFGLVGHNGAGKTTTIECLEGFRTPTSGRIRVLGLDPQTQTRQLRQRIGIQHQHAELPDRIKVREALDVFAAMYDRSVDYDLLIDQLGLGEKRNTTFAKLSGGQKQRLFIALALINKPDLVFLDELTTGLDPLARRDIWTLIQSIRERGTTVLLSTHFMDEAERLCDRIAIMKRGRIVALDTPANLKLVLSAAEGAQTNQPTLEDVFIHLTGEEVVE